MRGMSPKGKRGRGEDGILRREKREERREKREERREKREKRREKREEAGGGEKGAPDP